MAQQESTKQNIISLISVASRFGIKTTILYELLEESNIQRVKTRKGKWAITSEDFRLIKDRLPEIKEALEEKAQEKRKADKQQVRAFKNELVKNITVNDRERITAPDKTVMFVGPTNSGKTYHGLLELYRDFENSPDETHVYCGPLRLLAYEVYLKMVERYGADKVGFITGEEKINPNAKLLATTAEMAPMEGNSILIDEAHWLVDTERGHVWTRLLFSSEYKNLYVLTAGEAVPAIEALTGQSWFTDKQVFERKTPIVYGGEINISKLPPRTAVVCFSRKGVYAVASRLAKNGTKVGVLYGALPLETRKAQIDAYVSGKYDVMVVTDVIGHGINLPIDNVVFTQTDKFDGQTVRDVHVWEGAQIAGRAGRFGLSEQGKVFIGNGLPWFNADKELVKEFVLAAGGKIETDLSVNCAYIKPKITDFGLSGTGASQVAKLAPLIYQWQRKAFKTLRPNLSPAPLTIVQQNLEAIVKEMKIPYHSWDEMKTLSENAYPHVKVEANEVWQLSTGPFDSGLPTLSAVSQWLISPYRNDSKRLLKFYEEEIIPAIKSINKRNGSLEEHMEWLEKSVRIIGELKMTMIMFGEKHDDDLWLGHLRFNIHLIDAEKQLTTAITRKLNLNVKNSNVGICSTCGKATPLYHKLCNSCFQLDRHK